MKINDRLSLFFPIGILILGTLNMASYQLIFSFYPEWHLGILGPESYLSLSLIGVLFLIMFKFFILSMFAFLFLITEKRLAGKISFKVLILSILSGLYLFSSLGFVWINDSYNSFDIFLYVLTEFIFVFLVQVIIGLAYASIVARKYITSIKNLIISFAAFYAIYLVVLIFSFQNISFKHILYFILLINTFFFSYIYFSYTLPIISYRVRGILIGLIMFFIWIINTVYYSFIFNFSLLEHQNFILLLMFVCITSSVISEAVKYRLD